MCDVIDDTPHPVGAVPLNSQVSMLCETIRIATAHYIHYLALTAQ